MSSSYLPAYRTVDICSAFLIPFPRQENQDKDLPPS